MLEGLIEPSCDSGIEDEELFELTKKAKNELLAGVASLSDGTMFKDTKDYIHYKSIVPKDLYFNTDVEVQFNRLRNLLQKDSYDEIHDRLVQNGMRTGFACLFYGSPGTGKTEAALQLARITGRGIYQVNMANVRSKWVGESEKTVKGIFSQYQSIVNHSEVAPILLLNEADALLGNRFTNVNQSVEKMENTMQNIILEEMERLKGILIATTNLTENLDSAFERRFLFKLRFNDPDANVRLRIWESMIPEITSITNHMQIVDHYPFSGGQIENIARKCKIESILNGKAPDFDMLKTFCDEEILVKERSHVAGFRNAS
jgi:SpoVK/Ycf46/Vps4 family AAA+-type ATPase